MPTEVTLLKGSCAQAVPEARNDGATAKNLHDVLAVGRMKTSTMWWRKIINDVLSVRTYPKSTSSVQYAECLAAYVTLRQNGHSHYDAVEDLKALLRSLGVK